MITLISFIIVLIGSLNWLSIGFFQFDLVAGLFGTQASIFSRIIYIVVGISAIWLTYAIIRYKGRLTLKGGVQKDKEMLGIKNIQFENSQESAKEINKNQNKNSNNNSKNQNN